MTKSQQQRAENELIFKARNNQSSHLAEQVLDQTDAAEIPLRFICECSNEHCQERIEVTLADYQAIRHHPKRFVLVPGHEQTDIEEIVATDGYMVVEKYYVPPVTHGRLNQS